MKTLSERLTAALSQATTEAVGLVKGSAFVDKKGNLVEPPTVAEVLIQFDAFREQANELLGKLQAALDQQNQRVEQLNTTIASQAATITQLSANVGKKASADSLSTVNQKLTALASTVESKADSAFVDQHLQALVGVNTEQTSAIAAAVQAISSEDGLVKTILTKQANYDLLLPALRTDVDAKAAAATVSNLTGQVTAVRNAVNDSTTGLAAKAASAALVTVQQSVAQNTTDIGNRLRKDQADATAFPLSVPVASSMENAVRKSELVGGIQRPYRVFQNVGATPVGAYVRAGQAAPIADGLGLGQVFAMTTVRLRTMTAPALASTIKIYANGVEVYSTTVALTTIPGIGKTLDLLAITGASLPADITLPAALTASASAGTFEIITDGILK